ncbi:MAG: shikimate kinase AroK [Gammaproteobacteria bacterium]|nr:MAG: shikimate kinase AroK [Gammaproteobacteria bacterium]
MLAYLPAMPMMNNIFLIGPMGAGKSTIGRHLATLFKKDFVDVDQELVKRTGADISLIFDVEGESGFRKRESAMIKELTGRDNIVLATGGGAILAEENRKLLRSRGYVVYLQADIDTLLERTQKDKSRPLLQNVDRRKTFEEMMAFREPLYIQESDIIIRTDQRPPATVAKEVAEKISRV